MPPKQKQVKKGLNYKPSTASKDFLPSSIKQPPRQSCLIKVPENLPQPNKNEDNKTQLPFELWIPDTANKANQLLQSGQNSLYNDLFHKDLQTKITNSSICSWKHLSQLQDLKTSLTNEDINEQTQLNKEKQTTKSMVNIEIILPEQNEQNLEPMKEICMINTYQRSQTQQEMKQRLKDQAQKAQKSKDKKKGKKQEPKEELPVKVNDVCHYDVIIKNYMCQEAIWIGSQLQIIKQRGLLDVQTNQPIWRKIYPQENNLPKLNKLGKYIVKLYYMGAKVKVQCDDRIPINYYLQEMLPTSKYVAEKWTTILTKALIKYMIVLQTPIIGNGMIMYALTGMIPQTMTLMKFKEWGKLQELLNNEHYTKKDIIVTCYTKTSNKSPSNYQKKKSELKQFLLLQNSTYKQKTKLKRRLSEKIIAQYLQQEQQKQPFYMQNRIYKNYGYCIGNYFTNSCNFNMVFSQQKSLKQIKLRKQYLQLCKISLNNKDRQEKLEHRRHKKEIKQKLLQQEKKRLDLINQLPIQYHFMKIISNIKIKCQFSEKQILLAKKCVINGLKQPPNYDIPSEKEQIKSLKSFSIIKYKDEAIDQPIANLQDFSIIQGHVIELLQRHEKGVWIEASDLLQTFEFLQIFYNPNALPYKSIQLINKMNHIGFVYSEQKQILVVEKYQQQQLQKQQHSQQKQEQQININSNKKQTISLLFGFAFQSTNFETLNQSFCLLQKFDFGAYKTINNQLQLNNVISSEILQLGNKNSVFKIYTISKNPYCLWISSTSKYKLMSIGEYLCQFQGYIKKTFSIDCPILQKLCYLPLARIKIMNNSQQMNRIVLKLNGFKQSKQSYISYRLVKNTNKITQENQEGILRNNSEQKLLCFQYTVINIDPKSQYYLIVEIYPDENQSEGNLELIMLIQKQQELICQQIQEVQPIKFIAKYIPNKYGLIFKQRLFTKSLTNATFTVKVVQGEQIQAGNNPDKKTGKKGGKEQPSIEILQKTMNIARTIIVKVIKNQQNIFESHQLNQVNIPNLTLTNTKQDQKCIYYLQCSFDIRQWPQAQNISQDTQNIFWVVKVMAEDSIALVRDTQKEELEKKNRKSWEDQQPGRAEKAKKTRQKFLLQQKKNKGQALTEEEEELINAPRLTKKQQLEQNKKNQDKKGGKGAKKDDKKVGKEKKEEIVQKPIERIFPKSSQNHMNEIKRFLRTLQDCQVKYVELSEGSQPIIRSSQELQAFKQCAQMAQENRTGMLIRNIEQREMMKIRQKDKKQELNIYHNEANRKFKQKLQQYLQWRNQDQDKDKIKQEKQKILIEIIKQQKVTILETDLKKSIEQYSDINNYNRLLVEASEMIRKNIRIANLSEKISGHLVNWEVQELKVIQKQIEKDSIEGIEVSIIEQIVQMLDQVEKNPNIVQEKQNQAKKMKKGGKK